MLDFSTFVCSLLLTTDNGPSSNGQNPFHDGLDEVLMIKVIIHGYDHLNWSILNGVSTVKMCYSEASL